MRQLLARLARSQASAIGDAVASLRSELRPAAGPAWHLQWRGAATGGEEQPPAAPPVEAPAAAPKAAEAPAASSGATAAVTKAEEVSPAAPQVGTAPAAVLAAAAASVAPKQQQPQAATAPPQQQQQPGKPKTQQQGKAGSKAKPAAAKPAAAKPAAAKPAAAKQPAAASAPKKRPGVGSLLECAANRYIEVPAGILPEATAEFYKDPVLKGENVHEPNFGCKGVQREWEWSGQRSLLARACMRDLVQTVQGKERPQLYMDGWAGSGKSVALYSLVAWARANGWLALYIPSAFSLVQNGTFTRNEEDGLYDTPEAARWVLSSLRDAHAEQLASLKTPSGRPLAEVLEEGLAAGTKPGAVVAAAVAAKDALSAQTELPLLMAVDDYNVLYSHTGYYESVHNFHRRQLAPEELRLVRAFRVLEQPPLAHGVTVAAPTFGGELSAKLRLPLPKGCRYAMPRYSLPELQAAAQYFEGEVMRSAVNTDEDTLRRALFLTNGNGAELRRYMPGLLGLEAMPLGLSRGYKAEAARRRAHDMGQI